MSFSKLDTSNKKDEAEGSKWTGKLYFDRDCDNPNSAMSELTESLLVQILNELVSDEKILQVQMWKHPLNPYQLSDLIVYHCFLVLETNEWWWSIEKNTEGSGHLDDLAINLTKIYIQDHWLKKLFIGIKFVGSLFGIMKNFTWDQYFYMESQQFTLGSQFYSQ